jgi:two-component system, NarL family, sensor histidine kinase UhpB
MLLTETLIRSSLVPLRESNDPKAGLDRLIAELKNLRHASVSLSSQGRRDEATKDDDLETGWLSQWKGLPLSPLKIPVEIRGRLLDTIIVTPRPSDEFSELLEAFFRIFQWGTIVGIIMLAVTWFTIRHALEPIHALRDAIGRMTNGEFNLRVPEAGPPEIKPICTSLNILATTLQKAQQDNQRLTANMISIQDEERRDLARELHDELGPYLFSMRTDASLLGREFERPEIDKERARRLNDHILLQVDLLQQTNRRVLERLKPAGLEELGLSGAVRAMIEMWRRNKRDVELELSLEGDFDGLDDTLEVTVFRVIQEGLTNAFRHSAATRIIVDVVRLPAARDGRPAITLVIHDNGRGLSTDTVDGFGLKAMRERIEALSGSFAMTAVKGGGTRLAVSLPIRSPAPNRL